MGKRFGFGDDKSQSNKKPKSDSSQASNMPVKGAKPIGDSVGSDSIGNTSNPGTSQGVGSAPVTGSGPINAIRNGLSAAGQAVVNFGKSGLHTLLDSGFGTKPMMRAVSSFTSKTANFLHVPQAAAGVLLGTAVLGSVGTVATVYQQNAAMNLIVKQEDLDDDDDCLEDVEAMKSSASMGDTGGMAEEFAAKAWAVGKYIGLSDEQCAGMLGNMETESHMDASAIEGIYDEAFNVKGAKKSAAFSDLCAYTTTTLRQLYVKSGWSIENHTTSAGCHMAGHTAGKRIKSSAYEGLHGHYVPGIGLFQFTGPRGDAIVEYANAAGREWYEFDLQMAFFIDTTGGDSGAQWVHDWVGQSVGSPAQAAKEWSVHFEGNSSGTGLAGRVSNAEKWFAKFHGTAGDSAYAQSIIALADSVAGGMASGNKAAGEIEKCEFASKSFNNGDLARAAVAYAYETVDEGRGNNGTELFRFVHDHVAPRDRWYQSCDRGVATAVRWSDYDDDFPMGATGEQDAFCQLNSEQWNKVGEFGDDVMYEDLEPGDILITTSARRGRAHGHIVIYVSNEIVQEKFPGSDASFVSASFQERSPGCETWVSGKFYGQGYYVYRCATPDNSGLFKNIAEGKNLKDR